MLNVMQNGTCCENHPSTCTLGASQPSAAADFCSPQRRMNVGISDALEQCPRM